MSYNIEEIKKKKYGRLKILEISRVDSVYTKFALVKCDCGVEKETRLHAVLTGHTKSCGCLNKELAADRAKNRVVQPDKVNGSKNLVYSSYKYSAIKRDLVFNITREDFYKLIESNCYYCNIPPNTKKKFYKKEYMFNGVDRKDSNLGYDNSNCVPCCSKCNYAKGTAKFEEFIQWIKDIHNNLNLKE